MTQSSRPQAGNKNPVFGDPAYIDAGPWSRDQWAEKVKAENTGDANTVGQRTRLRGVMPTNDNMLVVTNPAGVSIVVGTGVGMVTGTLPFSTAAVTFTPNTPGIASRTDKVVLVENNTNVTYDGTLSAVILDFPTDLTDYSGAASVPPYACRLAILRGDAATGVATALVQSVAYWMIELARFNITNVPAVNTLTDYREFANIETVVGVHSANNTTIKDAAIIGTEVNDGMGAAGLGVGLRARLENAAGDVEDAGQVAFRWTDAANGSEDARYELRLSAGNVLNLSAVINAPTAVSADGNARGVGAVDLQQQRTAVTQVASGQDSFIAGGEQNTASGDQAHAEGKSVVASGDQAHAEGFGTTASGLGSHAEGGITTASGGYAHAEGGSTIASGTSAHAEGNETEASAAFSHAGGYRSVASKDRQFARSGGRIAANGDAQYSDYHLFRAVTHSDANWYELFLNGATTQITVAADQVMTFDVLLVGTTQGCTKSFSYRIVGIIENDGGTTTLLASTVTTIFEDDADFNARASADDPNDALLIEVTDATSGGDVVRWSAVVRTAEVTFPA